MSKPWIASLALSVFLALVAAVTLNTIRLTEETAERCAAISDLVTKHGALLRELHDRKAAELVAENARAAEELLRTEALDKAGRDHLSCKQVAVDRANEYLAQNGKSVQGSPGMYRAPKHIHDRIDTITRDGFASCDSAYNIAVQRYGSQYKK